MASIQKRGKSYAVLYRTRSGKQTSETFARRKDAEARKSAVEVELRNGGYIAPREGRVTFGAWFSLWQPTRKLSASGLDRDASLAKNHVLPRWADVPLDGITFMEAQAWVVGLSERLSPATVSAVFKLLRLPLEAAVQDGKLRMNPTLAVKLPAVRKRRNGPDDVLTAAELTRLVAEVPERYRALVMTMGWLGLRLSEALGLRVGDVNPLKKQVRVADQVVEEVAGRTTLRRSGKTNASARLLDLPGPLATVLADHVSAFVADPSNPEALLFQTARGTSPQRGNVRRRVLEPALKRAGLDGRPITSRQLRHTGASLMLDAGMDIQDVSQRMGHSRTSTTMDVYAHLLPGRKAAGTTALAASMLAAQEAL
jgi:integrase